MSNPVVQKYSELALRYDDEQNRTSCWGQATVQASLKLRVRPTDSLIVDVGCGTGRTLAELATRMPKARFVGVEPAEGMRKRAEANTRSHDNVRILDGSFERLPLASASVDYLLSLFAFHWTTDLVGSVTELARVLKPSGSMDLFFIGRNNGREFIRATSSIFLRFLGAKGLVEAAGLRKQLTLEEARNLFGTRFDVARLHVQEEFRTYHDSLEGHWGWWVRIEGQFVQIPPERKTACEEQVRRAVAALETEQGIPYTLHQLHVHVGPA